MKKTIIFALTIVIFLGGCVLLAQADEKRPVLESSTRIFRVVNGEKIELTEKDQVQTGEILHYEETYVNTGNDIASGIQFDIPIDDPTSYVGKSAECDDCEIIFSVDEGQSFAKPPIIYSIIDPDGNEIEKTAEPSDYTTIRFIPNNDLEPGESITFKYSMKISKDYKEEK